MHEEEQVIPLIFNGISDPALLKQINDCKDDQFAIAKTLESRVVALSASTTARAFEVGALLGVIQDNKLYRKLGFATFKDFLKAHGLAKTTINRDIKVAKLFNLNEHGELGITRLRLLAGRTDAMDLISNGLPLADGKREPLVSVKSRALQAFLKTLPAANTMVPTIAAFKMRS